MPDTPVFYMAGMAIPLCYIFLYVLGGALRPGYSHVAHSVSELLSPGAPNRPLLMSIQTLYAVLHILFGLAVLLYVKGYAEGQDMVKGQGMGLAGAWMIIALGVVTLGTVFFPQDAEGSVPTRAGQIHKILVFGGLIPLSVLTTLLIGLWSRQTAFIPGFDLYSFITVGAVVVMGGVGGATVETRFAGLVERLAAIVTQQWLFVLGLILFRL